MRRGTEKDTRSIDKPGMRVERVHLSLKDGRKLGIHAEGRCRLDAWPILLPEPLLDILETEPRVVRAKPPVSCSMYHEIMEVGRTIHRLRSATVVSPFNAL